MEPLNDKELNQLLQRWEAPAAPRSLHEKLAPPSPSRRWRWLLTGSIRIPVPVGIAAIVAFVVWMLVGRTPPIPVTQPAASITLADFQPVRQLEPRIVTTEEKGSNENKEQQYK
jgi:hypothetical protein